jgi:ABC-2 type transport system ATP-binding protein
MPDIIIEEVVKYFDSRKALDKVSIKINGPLIFGLLGPNGAGKTTLLSIIAGIIEPDEGWVRINGLEPKSPEARKNLGYYPQEHGLIEHLSGYDNALFYGRLYGLPKREIVRKTRDLARRLGLSEIDLKRKVGTYSGGMKKKLALAISILHDPEVLVLDEPTTGMDPPTRREVWELLLSLRREGKIVILATHYMEEAEILSDVVAVIHQGRILTEGTPEELKKKYGPKTVVELKLEEKPRKGMADLVAKHTNLYYLNETSLKIHVDEPETLVPALIRDLYSAGYHVAELRLRRPSLEDVFLKLAGRRIDEG